MKYMRNLVRLLILIFFLISNAPKLHAVSYPKQNFTFSSSTTNAKNFPLTMSSRVTQFSIDGNFSLYNLDSFVRAILIDTNGFEYLIYEANTLTEEKFDIHFIDICEETCNLLRINPKQLRIELHNASMNISNIYTSGGNNKKDKLQKIHKQITKLGLRWQASETPISRLSYSEKKKLFRQNDGKPIEILPNLYGFEYYSGGVFSIAKDSSHILSSSVEIGSTLPASWDWRNVHGQNWITTVKNQGINGTCTAFAYLGAFEALINIYSNQHLDFDLSEQSMINCGVDLRQWDNSCFGGSMCVLRNIGVVDETCVPYVGEQPNSPCEIGCQNYSSMVKKPTDLRAYMSESFPLQHWQLIPINHTNGDEAIMRTLIKNGPLEISGVIEYHSMALIGYKTDPIDGRPIFIVKNSWGTNWGNGGFAEMKVDPVKYDISPGGVGATYFTGPIIGQEEIPIACHDQDSDGYCSWGISEIQPITCDSSCRPIPDCDDSNANLGAFDNNYNCMPIDWVTPTLASTPATRPGDANNDFIVDAQDFSVWVNQYAQYGQSITGMINSNFNNDLIVDGRDYIIWMNNFGL